MSARRELLTHLFRLLEERHLPYCVLRNYHNLFTDPSSDVDLLTEPGCATAVIGCCLEAGVLAGHSLVQRTRFVNHSLVLWNGADDFTRLDIDTEKRWRRCHLLTARQILQQRQRFTSFYIPDPRHEVVILLTQALWQKQLSERYTARLRELDQQIPDKASLVAVLGEAFGRRENLLLQLADPTLPARLRGAVRHSVRRQPARAARSLGYLVADALRLLARLKSPPGIVVRTVAVGDADEKALRSKLAVLFPASKAAHSQGPSTRAVIRKTLFKGGLLIESFPVADKPARVFRDGWRSPERSFAATREPDGTAHFLHIGTGSMRSSQDFAGGGADFIGTTLARQLAVNPAPRPGVFAVLVGLDGSGKTTVARNLAALTARDRQFAGMRYHHWLPGRRRLFEFPLPDPANYPRKEKLAGGFLLSVISVARLAKNLLRAHLAYRLRLRPRLRAGFLVLVDRYFYNYYLDPVSVKYYGPKWALDLAGRWFPRPDLVVTLNVPADVLRQRKQELSEAEIQRQFALLQTMNFFAPTAAVDANQSPAEVARTVMQAILKINR